MSVLHSEDKMRQILNIQIFSCYNMGQPSVVIMCLFKIMHLFLISAVYMYLFAHICCRLCSCVSICKHMELTYAGMLTCINTYLQVFLHRPKHMCATFSHHIFSLPSHLPKSFILPSTFFFFEYFKTF